MRQAIINKKITLFLSCINHKHLHTSLCNKTTMNPYTSTELAKQISKNIIVSHMNVLNAILRFKSETLTRENYINLQMETQNFCVQCSRLEIEMNLSELSMDEAVTLAISIVHGGE